MIQARLKKNFNENVKLSVQHVLNCNMYNQGCEGGYPFLVSKFASEFELVPESCHKYKAKTGQCGVCNVDALDKVYKVKNFRYKKIK